MNYRVTTAPKIQTPTFKDLEVGTLFSLDGGTSVYKKVHTSEICINRTEYNAVNMITTEYMLMMAHDRCIIHTDIHFHAVNKDGELI